MHYLHSYNGTYVLFEGIVWELRRPNDHQVHQHLRSLAKGDDKRDLNNGLTLSVCCQDDRAQFVGEWVKTGALLRRAVNSF